MHVCVYRLRARDQVARLVGQREVLGSADLIRDVGYDKTSSIVSVCEA